MTDSGQRLTRRIVAPETPVDDAAGLRGIGRRGQVH
jgi:hypothetical protein